jgi:hypothetical protein
MITLEREEVPPSDEDGYYKSLCFVDPRSRHLGMRVVSSPETEVQLAQELQWGTSEEYRAFRLS